MPGDADDPTALRTGVYRTDAGLRARIDLHARFSTNPGWYRWVFEQLDLAPDARVLELGCGTGDFWVANADRLPAGWRLHLSDLSEGMLRAALDEVGRAWRRVPGMVTDAQAVPADDATFDAVVANQMLYPVPDRDRALVEVRRVLRPGGRLYAATNGRAHLRELRELVDAPGGWSDDPFGLETGPAQLARRFAEVTARRYPDALEVTEVEPVLAYLRTMPTLLAADPGAEARVAAAVAAAIPARGAFHVTKDLGLLLARRPG
jgi:SAM-dependent methyltransferase